MPSSRNGNEERGAPAATGHPALNRFLEARSDGPERASALALPDRASAQSLTERASAQSLTERASAQAPNNQWGIEYGHRLTALLDAALAEAAGPDPAWAVVAVGGSGRREQCRHSDIDVMLLVPYRAVVAAARSLYPLWDAGLKVGHAVRTVDQALAAATEHIDTFTALLDARLVHGREELFDRFVRGRERVVRTHRGWMHQELAANRTALVQREPWQVMAVDLKQSRGGLRDLHAIHWLDTAEAIANADSAASDTGPLDGARELLLRTRHAVHALHQRPTDSVQPEEALTIAAWLGVDRMQWARDLALAMREIDAAVSERLAQPPPASTGRRWWFPWRRSTPAAPPVDAPAPAAPEPAALEPASDLERLLAHLRTAAAGGPLEPLPPAPWLERLLPEWEALRARPHIAPFHVNPVDVHILRCVAEVRRAMEEEDRHTGAHFVAREFDRPDIVLLAALLHDIGKGQEGDHSEVGALIVERFAERAGLDAGTGRLLAAAVRHHLLLPGVATRRDIADEAVIRETAALIGAGDTLRLLYLLAIADARASGPNVWSEWKAELLRRLYQRLLAVVNGADHAATVTPIETIVAALADRLPAAAVRDHLEGLTADYRLSTAPEVIGDHIELIAHAAERPAVHHGRVGEIDHVTVVTRDRPGLLQAITGALAGRHANVLGGVAYTRLDGIAIQVWHVRDGLNSGFDERRWRQLLDAIPAAIDGTSTVEDRLAEVRAAYPDAPRTETPARIEIDNDIPGAHTILEVTTADRRGLLYAITRALFEQEIDIHLAKVDTIGPEVVDVFYVRHRDGGRVDAPEDQQRLRDAVSAAIAALDAT